MTELPEAHCSECKIPLEYPRTMCARCERRFSHPQTRDESPRALIGFWCPSHPDGPLIPPGSFDRSCGDDKAVYSDGTTEHIDGTLGGTDAT